MENKHQAEAIRLSASQHEGEDGAHDDHEGQVHTCPSCGHEMPMEEVHARAGAIELSEADESAENHEHMDEEHR